MRGAAFTCDLIASSNSTYLAPRSTFCFDHLLAKPSDVGNVGNDQLFGWNLTIRHHFFFVVILDASCWQHQAQADNLSQFIVRHPAS